ncbi:hypothetical protein P3S67_027664 [Capsicum chacoense]
MPSAAAVSLVSKCTIFPSQKSSLSDLKLSVSDLPMFSVHYIKKGCLFICISFHVAHLISRFVTDLDGYVYISCNDVGVDFVHSHFYSRYHWLP